MLQITPQEILEVNDTQLEDVLHNDDTTVKILELMGQRGRQEARSPCRRSVHEPDLHLPVERRQSIRLPDPVAAACGPSRGQPSALDTLELL